MVAETKISAVIITFNEENNLARCLDSLKSVVSEIVVVDSYSTDKTEEICISRGVRFFQHEFQGHIEQKNYAISKASYDLVLSLDADEALSKELIQSISAITGTLEEAYSMNRLTSYCGKWIKHCGWYPDTKIRLWDRRKGKWGGTNPHDSVKLDEGLKPKFIKGNILHYSYHTIDQHLGQMNKFSSIAAKEAFLKRKRANVLIHLILYPAFTFFKSYVLKLGFLDGYYGFIVCRNGAYYRFLKYAKLIDLYKNKIT